MFYVPKLSDTNETLSDQTCTNQAIEGARRKLEQEMQALNVSFLLKRQHHEIISCYLAHYCTFHYVMGYTVHILVEKNSTRKSNHHHLLQMFINICSKIRNHDFMHQEQEHVTKTMTLTVTQKEEILREKKGS